MKIVAVLVLYKRSAEESETFRSLREAVREIPTLGAQLSLEIYDNSPDEHGHAPIGLDRVSYCWRPENPGLAAAYQSALEATDGQGSSMRGAEWLLLLDHDTVLTVEYLREAIRLVQEVGPEVVAIVPKLMHGGAVHSPHRLPRLSHHGLAPDFFGVAGEELSAYNSAALMRASAVRAIGGFPAEFPLDFLDHAVFHALQQAGGRIYVMQEGLQHDLSTMSLGGEASLARYRKVLAAEREFYREVGGWDAAWYRVRRLKQFAGHMVKVRDKGFALLDLRAALGLL